jgi:hypothetical protein
MEAAPQLLVAPCDWQQARLMAAAAEHQWCESAPVEDPLAPLQCSAPVEEGLLLAPVRCSWASRLETAAAVAALLLPTHQTL